MLDIKDSEQFRQLIIAQDDDCDYSESGWVAVVQGKYAGLARYSHCSCYGTWTSITDHTGALWLWQGTVTQLVKLAKNKKDPAIPKRDANPHDYDYNHLIKVYKQIGEWTEKQNLNKKIIKNKK